MTDDFRGVHVFPIQIREDLVVRFAPIPLDLTLIEAEKICRVVRALATPESIND